MRYNATTHGDLNVASSTSTWSPSSEQQRSVVFDFEADELQDAIRHLGHMDGRLAEHQPSRDQDPNARSGWLDWEVVEPLGNLLLDPEQIEPDEVVGRRFAVWTPLRPKRGVDIIEEPGRRPH